MGKTTKVKKMPYMEFSTVYESEEDAIEDMKEQEESDTFSDEDNEVSDENDDGLADNVSNNAKRASPKFKYGFEVEKGDNEILIGFSKTYGDMHGGSTRAETPQEAIKIMQKKMKMWEEFDSIVQRQGDKVRKDNLYFKSDIPEITVGSLFNEKSLTEWFK
jgi:hypothetical protein